MIYIKKFNTESEYSEFKDSGEFVIPNVSAVVNDNIVHYKPYIKQIISLCDIAYYNNDKVETVSKEKWNVSLGTPIGVVVIPEGMLPDGKARIVSIDPIDFRGSGVTYYPTMVWDDERIYDSPLTNYGKVPTTDNTDSNLITPESRGFLPSDKFSGVQSFVDNKSKYSTTDQLVPSPYLGNDNTFNEIYGMDIEGGNSLSDFNGLSNTQTLVNSGSNYIAANAAWNYTEGRYGIQWYLPAMGELGFLMPRFNEINEALTYIGGMPIDDSDSLWSSTENSLNNALRLTIETGHVYSNGKHYEHHVRPFALI